MNNHESTFFESPDDWKDFSKYLTSVNRFSLAPQWKQFIQTLIDTAGKRTETLKAGAKLARARMGINESEREDESGEWHYDRSPLSRKEMGAPPGLLVVGSRMNPSGISYLYLSNQIKTAIAEVRPWVGSEVSVGIFRILRDLKILNTTNDRNRLHHISTGGELPSLSAAEKEGYVWSDINEAFSRPITPGTEHISYIPTQYVAEVFKSNKYDGIFYKSSLSEAGFNVVLFDPATAFLTSCGMYDIKSVEYKYDQSGNPYSVKEG